MNWYIVILIISVVIASFAQILLNKSAEKTIDVAFLMTSKIYHILYIIA